MSEKKRKSTESPKGKAPKIVKTDAGEFRTEEKFKELLLRSTVESLAYRKNEGVVFFVDRNDKLLDVFKGLVKHNFLSAPVLQKTKRKWYGFIEIGDIVRFYVDHFGAQLGDEGKKVWDHIAEEEGFDEKTVNDVIKFPLARENPFHPIRVGYSLHYALETLAREGLDRVPIIDADRNLKSVLSVSQVISFIHENIEMIGTIKNKPLKDVPSIHKTVITVKEDERAIDAFKKMQEKNVHGLAVVGSSGKLIGNISERDLKGIRIENQLFQRLFQKVGNFLKHVQEEQDKEEQRPKQKQVVKESDTLETAILLLVSHQIHRLYLVDSQEVPIGVVSLKDILLEIITN